MPDLLDEVEEDLRAERMQRLGRRYGGLLLVALALAIGGVAGVQGWRWYQARQSETAAEAFLAIGRDAAAADADQKVAAERFTALGGTAPPGYALLARLRAAALKAQPQGVNDLPGALTIWDGIANDPSVDPLYRGLATLLWGLHSIDAGDPAAIETRLRPLAAEGQPWRASAQEILALAAIRRGETEAAKRSLTTLAADATAPQGVRDRATRVLSSL